MDVESEAENGEYFEAADVKYSPPSEYFEPADIKYSPPLSPQSLKPLHDKIIEISSDSEKESGSSRGSSSGTTPRLLELLEQKRAL